MVTNVSGLLFKDDEDAFAGEHEEREDADRNAGHGGPAPAC